MMESLFHWFFWFRVWWSVSAVDGGGGKPRRTARQQSSIDRLPADIRAKLEELLRDPAWTQLDACAEINELMENQGLGYRLSKSSINRYFQRMEIVGAKIRQSREIADMWIANLGNAPQGKVGQLLNEIIRNLAFDTAVALGEGSEPAAPKALKELAQAVRELEAASTLNEKREMEIRRKVLQEAQANAEQAAKTKGVSADGIAAIRAAIAGELA